MTPSPDPAVAPSSASISVVIPTFNDAGRITDALNSILQQTVLPAEIVVADDCSEDHTEQVVRQFADAHAGRLPVRYTRLAARSGDAGARNAGVAAAAGQWIAICDSDDIWAPTKLERQIVFLQSWAGSRPIVLLGSHGYNVNDAKQVISPAVMGPTSEEEYDAVRQRGGLFFVIHSSVLFCRRHFDALGGYSTAEYGAANEFDLFGRMAERGVVLNTPEPLVYYRKRAGSMQLDRFWDRHHNVLRLKENQRRRVNGQAAVSKEEFAAQLAAAPAWRRFTNRKRAWGMFYYRAGATNFVNGRKLQGSLQLALAATLDTTRLQGGVRNVFQGRLARRVPVRHTPTGDPATVPLPHAQRRSIP
jgi:glycosyltransferase involved in cell wall biosynthesis